MYVHTGEPAPPPSDLTIKAEALKLSIKSFKKRRDADSELILRRARIFERHLRGELTR